MVQMQVLLIKIDKTKGGGERLGIGAIYLLLGL